MPNQFQFIEIRNLGSKLIGHRPLAICYHQLKHAPLVGNPCSLMAPECSTKSEFLFDYKLLPCIYGNF